MQNTPAADFKPRPPRSRVDIRRRALVITTLATLALGALFTWDPQAPAGPSQARLRFADVFTQPVLTRPLSATKPDELRTRFEQGVMMLQMRQYEYALTAFHQVLALEPKLPEAHVNMGFALLGLEQWKGARDFFESAIELRRDQMNAYYGLAIALEGQGDMPGAMGAMQAYLHRAATDDPFRTRAESALWEWRTGKTKPEPASLEHATLSNQSPADFSPNGRR